eukprot:jgi/Picsp_1/959/NSC_04443-R1_chlorophyll a oxygenase
MNRSHCGLVRAEASGMCAVRLGHVGSGKVYSTQSYRSIGKVVNTTRRVYTKAHEESSCQGGETAAAEESGSFFQNVVDTAPRIRVRRATDRARDQLADLAVLNERLKSQDEAGAVQARTRVEFLKRRRKIWQKVYEYVLDNDIECTLSSIEEANSKVQKALSDEMRDKTSILDLKKTLQSLQDEVVEANEKLIITKAKVEENVKRMNEFKQNAEVLERTLSTDSSGVQQANVVPFETERLTVMPKGRKSSGLESSLKLEEELKNHWFAVQFSSTLEKDMMIPFDLFGEPWVIFREKDGKAACVKDECAHRACPVSVGTVVDGEVQCPYHGWQFNGQGSCTKMPSTAMCKGIKIKTLPVVEVDGMIWVWPGWREPTGTPEGVAAAPDGFKIHAEIEVEVPVEHGLLIENLLDLAHAPFTHTTTFARGWPVPEVVRFKAAEALSGAWHPYPIDMEFRPPCVTVSTIGLAQPGKIERNVGAKDCQNHLHQIHVCLPSKEGHTRLLYRMSMDFLDWARYIPGIKSLWKYVAGQVLGEDLVLVQGQQDRLLRGGNTWRNPVSYDKIAVRYRRWRNHTAKHGAANHSEFVGMDAHEMFSLDEDVEE